MAAVLEMVVETKWCPRCKTDKPIGEFGINRARYDGRKVYCSPCQREYDKPRRKPRPRKEKPPAPPAPAPVFEERPAVGLGALFYLSRPATDSNAIR